MKMNYSNRLSDTEWFRQLVMILVSVLLALLVGAVFVSVLGKNPIEAYYYMLVTPFTSLGDLGEIFIKMTPLLMIGVGVSFAKKAGLMNLGGQGQIYMGALGTILVSFFIGEYSPFVSIPLSLLTGALFGALYSGIAGVFKAYFKSSEIITTLLLNYIAIELISFLVQGPLRDPLGVNPQTVSIPESMKLLRIPELIRGNIGIFIALAAVLIYWVVIAKTPFGYNLRVVGGSLDAANYSGINLKKMYIQIMLISGAFAGMVGMIEVTGTQYRLLSGLAGDFGFNGIVVALLGLLHPVGIVVAAFFLAALSVGAETMQVMSGVPVTLLGIIQGVIVLSLLVGFSFKKKPAKIQMVPQTPKGGSENE